MKYVTFTWLRLAMQRGHKSKTWSTLDTPLCFVDGILQVVRIGVGVNFGRGNASVAQGDLNRADVRDLEQTGSEGVTQHVRGQAHTAKLVSHDAQAALKLSNTHRRAVLGARQDIT